ncbi:MAG: hypothetical protein GX053_14535 [Tissierella sp.]|nr:hypothetical protein [Tissierella sp.]
MMDEVRKAILRKINSFRDRSTTKIYSEEIEQDFQEPCFYVRELRSNQEKELGGRYKRGHFYNIHYFPNPNSETKNSDLRKMAETLYDQMEYIEVSGRPLMGLDMNHRIVDGVLHFFVKYPIFVYKETDFIPTMENLEHEGGLKDG